MRWPRRSTNGSQGMNSKHHHRTGRFLFRLFFVSFAGWALVALGRGRGDDFEYPRSRPRVWGDRDEAAGDQPTASDPKAGDASRKPSTARRAAVASMFTALFFAGAAFTAGAGDQAAKLLQDSTDSTTTAEVTEAAPSDPAQPAADAASAAPAEVAPAADPAPSTQGSTAAAAAAAGSSTPDASAPAADASSGEVAPATAGAQRAA